jgi:hypothetical protein
MAEYREGHDKDCLWATPLPTGIPNFWHCTCGYDAWYEKQLELIVKAGCACLNPLLGYRPNVGPRCRLCGTVADISKI